MALLHKCDDDSRTLLFFRGDSECVILDRFYAGLRFNQIRLTFLPPRTLALDPERDDLEVLFNVSGSRAVLERHAFAHSSWLSALPPSGTSHRCATEGFGNAWHVAQTRTGFRLQGASYVDNLSKLSSALLQMTWKCVASRRPDGPAAQSV